MNAYAAQSVERSSSVGRPKKFTPERIWQIINLVERGKSPAEIAQLIGVPVGSLSVTCSRLGISLRPPRLGNGVRQLRRAKPVYTASTEERRSSEPPDAETTPSPLKHGVETSSVENTAHRPPLAEFSFHLTYKGRERTYPIPLTSDVLKQLALEAALQKLTLGELITRLMRATLEKHNTVMNA